MCKEDWSLLQVLPYPRCQLLGAPRQRSFLDIFLPSTRKIRILKTLKLLAKIHDRLKKSLEHNITCDLTVFTRVLHLSHKSLKACYDSFSMDYMSKLQSLICMWSKAGSAVSTRDKTNKQC